MNTTTSPDFSKVLADAEKQVSGIQNEKLREIAFGKLVSHLLDNGSSQNEHQQGAPIKHKTRKIHRAVRSIGKAKTSGPKAWLKELVEEDFFKKPKSSSNIIEELENRSHHLKATDLTRQLQELCHDRLLRRKKLSPETGGREVFHWSNW